MAARPAAPVVHAGGLNRAADMLELLVRIAWLALGATVATFGLAIVVKDGNDQDRY